MILPASSSESAARDEEPRFHRKLRNGLFERDRGLPIFNEPVFDGVVGDIGIERRSEPPADFIFTMHLGDFFLYFGGSIH